MILLAYINLAVHRRFVAVKVGMGKDDTNPSTEARILQHVQQTKAKGRGQEHIVKLHDFFTIRGPNGYHECLITELVIPLSALDMETRKRLHPQSLIRQLALGFDYLHSQNIAHGGKLDAEHAGACSTINNHSPILVQIRITEI